MKEAVLTYNDKVLAEMLVYDNHTEGITIHGVDADLAKFITSLFGAISLRERHLVTAQTEPAKIDGE